MNNDSGVYIIKNTANGKCYVGSAVNFHKRWILHKCTLRKGNHHSPHLQSSWNKHGEEAFTFEVLEATHREAAVKAEQAWMDKLQPEYNMSPTAGSALGTKHSEATKAQMAAAHKGRVVSEESRAKMVASAQLRRDRAPHKRNERGVFA